MKRKAILIESSNVLGQGNLPGAKVDIDNWKSFLKSDLGGSWLDSEIVALSKPDSNSVTAHLSAASDCYCFVAFSGHGEDGSIVLNDYRQDFPVIGLRPKGSRGVVVVDACRGVSAGRYNFANKTAALMNENTGPIVAYNATVGRSTNFSSEALLNRANSRASSLQSLRSAWEGAFSSTTGIVEMLACSKGQGAGEDAAAGGYYTSLLLASAESWNNKYSSLKIHSTKDAHDYAAANLPSQQTPVYSPVWVAYPFAVKA